LEFIIMICFVCVKPKCKTINLWNVFNLVKRICTLKESYVIIALLSIDPCKMSPSEQNENWRIQGMVCKQRVPRIAPTSKDKSQ